MRCFDIHLKEEFPFLGEAGRDPVLSVYLPWKITEANYLPQGRPCMVVCPGGGYSICSQREKEVVGMPFLADGYNVFVLHYSVAPHHFPVQLREVAAVMELIYANAADWDCNLSQIAVMGFSAGGHLACHYSNAYNCPEVREVFPQSKAVNASVLGYPVITGDPSFAHLGSIQNLSGHKELTQADIEKFSCEKLVTKNTPPAFIWHTAEDAAVPVRNSLVYAQALAEAGIPYELHIFPWGRHGLSTVDRQTSTDDQLNPRIAYATEWLDQAKRWLKLVF